jgi:hypothetical protein
MHSDCIVHCLLHEHQIRTIYRVLFRLHDPQAAIRKGDIRPVQCVYLYSGCLSSCGRDPIWHFSLVVIRYFILSLFHFAGHRPSFLGAATRSRCVRVTVDVLADVAQCRARFAALCRRARQDRLHYQRLRGLDSYSVPRRRDAVATRFFYSQRLRLASAREGRFLRWVYRMGNGVHNLRVYRCKCRLQR